MLLNENDNYAEVTVSLLCIGPHSTTVSMIIFLYHDAPSCLILYLYPALTNEYFYVVAARRRFIPGATVFYFVCTVHIEKFSGTQ